jgi:hypothetical protein
MTRVEQLQNATSSEEVDKILDKDSAFTLIGTDLTGDQIRVTMFVDNSGIIVSYHGDVALAVPLTDVELSYCPNSHMLVVDDALN